MKLPNKIEFSTNGDHAFLYRLTINQLIDYLAEREGREEEINEHNWEAHYPIPLFKAEYLDLQVMNDRDLPYLASRFYRTEAEAEQAREALLKLTE